MDAVPVVADAKEALPRLEKLLEGYQPAYKNEISTAKEKWIDELNRLDHITFSDKKSWKPEINDANADSAKASRPAHRPPHSPWWNSRTPCCRCRCRWKPEINDANADSAKRFAQDVNAQLTQTAALGALNAMMSEGDVAIGQADIHLFVFLTGGDQLTVEHIEAAVAAESVDLMLVADSNNLQVGHGNVTLCTELRYRNKDGLFGDFMDIDYAKVAEAYGCKSYNELPFFRIVNWREYSQYFRTSFRCACKSA